VQKINPKQVSDMSFPRSLTSEERTLVKWMLEHGEPGADRYLAQLEEAVVISGCRCGCASINFQIGDKPAHYKPGLTVISDHAFRRGANGHFGVFVFTEEDMLSGLEVYGFDETPGPLPTVDELIPFKKDDENT
jgi:hypothetical protein